MGNNNQPLSSSSSNSAKILEYFSKRFVISGHPYDPDHLSIFHLHERLADNRYLLRVLSTNDSQEKEKIEELVCKKLAMNKSKNYPKITPIQNYLFQQDKGYCNNLTKCFITFHIGNAQPLTHYLTKKKYNPSPSISSPSPSSFSLSTPPFNPTQIYQSLLSLIQSVSMLKYYSQPHKNINAQTVYIANGRVMLLDPWLVPLYGENAKENLKETGDGYGYEQYPPPQKLALIRNQIVKYDYYVGDLFSIGMVGLKMAGCEKLKELYGGNGSKKNLDYPGLMREVEKIQDRELRGLLEELLSLDLGVRQGVFYKVRQISGNGSYGDEKQLGTSQLSATRSRNLSGKVASVRKSFITDNKPISRFNINPQPQSQPQSQYKPPYPQPNIPTNFSQQSMTPFTKQKQSQKITPVQTLVSNMQNNLNIGNQSKSSNIYTNNNKNDKPDIDYTLTVSKYTFSSPNTSNPNINTNTNTNTNFNPNKIPIQSSKNIPPLPQSSQPSITPTHSSIYTFKSSSLPSNSIASQPMPMPMSVPVPSISQNPSSHYTNTYTNINTNANLQTNYNYNYKSSYSNNNNFQVNNYSATQIPTPIFTAASNLNTNLNLYLSPNTNMNANGNGNGNDPLHHDSSNYTTIAPLLYSNSEKGLKGVSSLPCYPDENKQEKSGLIGNLSQKIFPHGTSSTNINVNNHNNNNTTNQNQNHNHYYNHTYINNNSTKSINQLKTDFSSTPTPIPTPSPTSAGNANNLSNAFLNNPNINLNTQLPVSSSISSNYNYTPTSSFAFGLSTPITLPHLPSVIPTTSNQNSNSVGTLTANPLVTPSQKQKKSSISLQPSPNLSTLPNSVSPTFATKIHSLHPPPSPSLSLSLYQHQHQQQYQHQHQHQQYTEHISTSTQKYYKQYNLRTYPSQESFQNDHNFQNKLYEGLKYLEGRVEEIVNSNINLNLNNNNMNMNIGNGNGNGNGGIGDRASPNVESYKGNSSILHYRDISSQIVDKKQQSQLNIKQNPTNSNPVDKMVQSIIVPKQNQSSNSHSTVRIINQQINQQSQSQSQPQNRQMSHLHPNYLSQLQQKQKHKQKLSSYNNFNANERDEEQEIDYQKQGRKYLEEIQLQEKEIEKQKQKSKYNYQDKQKKNKNKSGDENEYVDQIQWDDQIQKKMVKSEIITQSKEKKILRLIQREKEKEKLSPILVRDSQNLSALLGMRTSQNNYQEQLKQNPKTKKSLDQPPPVPNRKSSNSLSQHSHLSHPSHSSNPSHNETLQFLNLNTSPQPQPPTLSPTSPSQPQPQQPQFPSTPPKPSHSHSLLHLANNLTIPEQSQQQSLSESTTNLQIQKPKGQYIQEIYQNGGKYIGYMYNGQRNGNGVFYYKDGGYYDGRWKNNMMNGYGKLYYQTGKLAYEGQWYQDQFHGRGIVYNDQPELLTEQYNYRDMTASQNYWQYYQGDLSHDMKARWGKLVLSNGQYYEGQFRNDMVHGKGVWHKSSGGVVRGVWVQGVLVREG